MKNLMFAENRLVFRGGGVDTARTGSEKLTSREIKDFDKKLNNLTKGFDKINSGNVKNILKNDLKTNLEERVKNQLKQRLDPNNPKNAEQLFAVIYPPEKLKPILQKAAQNLNQTTFNVSNDNVKNIIFGCHSRFMNYMYQECGADQSSEPSISLNGKTQPSADLASKLSKEPGVKAEKIKAAVAKSREIATKTVVESAKQEMRPQIQAKILNITKNIG